MEKVFSKTDFGSKKLGGIFYEPSWLYDRPGGLSGRAAAAAALSAMEFDSCTGQLTVWSTTDCSESGGYFVSLKCMFVKFPATQG